MEARDLLRETAHPFELSLRIRHPSMDPAAISRELHLEPDHCFRSGEPRESVSGIAAAAVHLESYWLASLDPNAWAQSTFEMSLPSQVRGGLTAERLRGVGTVSLGLALTLCTTHFLKTHAEFVRRIQTEGGEVALIVELSPQLMQPFTLTPQVSRVLTDLGVHIDFDFSTD